MVTDEERLVDGDLAIDTDGEFGVADGPEEEKVYPAAEPYPVAKEIEALSNRIDAMAEVIVVLAKSVDNLEGLSAELAALKSSHEILRENYVRVVRALPDEADNYVPRPKESWAKVMTVRGRTGIVGFGAQPFFMVRPYRDGSMQINEETLELREGIEIEVPEAFYEKGQAMGFWG